MLPSTSAGSAGCPLCLKPFGPEGPRVVNGTPICETCAAEVARELEAEQAGAAVLPRAIAGGVAGAVLGGIGWALIAVATGMYVGYVAVGIGWLAGSGVGFAAGGRRGPVLQVIAAASAGLGLALGRYLHVAHMAIEAMSRRRGAEDLHYLSPPVVEVILRNLSSFLDPFDLIWILIAVSCAWRLVAATPVTLGEPAEPPPARSPPAALDR